MKIVIAVVGAVLMLAACGADGDGTSAADSIPTDGSVKFGEPIKGGNYVFTGVSASDDTEFPDPAEEGFKYVSFTVKVKNESQEGIDLSCGMDIGVQIMDSTNSSYGLAPHLERVPGNPACGDLVQPGEEGQVTYVSRTPVDFQIANAAVEDMNNQDGLIRNIRLR